MKYSKSIYANAADVMTWEKFRGMIRCTRRPELILDKKLVHVIAIDIVGYERHLFYRFEEIEKYIDEVGEEQHEEIGQSKNENQDHINQQEIRSTAWRNAKEKILNWYKENQQAIYIDTDSIKENNSIEEAIFRTFTGDSYH